MKSYKVQNSYLHQIQLELAQMGQALQDMNDCVTSDALFTAEAEAFRLKAEALIGKLCEVARSRQRGLR